MGRFVGLIFDTCGQPLFTRVDRSEVVVYDLFSHPLTRSEVGVSLAFFHTCVDRSEATFLCI